MPTSLRVVRFRGVGMCEIFKLALCKDHDDGSTTVIYDDQTCRCPTSDLTHFHHVTYMTLKSKATVRAALKTDGPALRAVVRDNDLQVSTVCPPAPFAAHTRCSTSGRCWKKHSTC